MIPNAAFDRALEHWLEAAAPTKRPAGLHESVIKRAATIRQRPAWFAALRVGRFRRTPRRFVMTRLQFRLAMAAVIGVLAIGGSLYLVQRGQPSVGTPSSSPTLQSSPTPSLGASQPAATASSVPVVAASWTATGSLITPRWLGIKATLLQDGKVLVAGGRAPRAYASLASAELYDPATGTWTATGSMTTARSGYTATLLQSGKVLVAGGYDTAVNNPALASSAELYDPATGTWTATGSMTTTRFGYTATLLQSGKVLVAGGIMPGAGPSGGFAATGAELYDPATGTWTATGSMTTARGGHTATLLTSGRVLVAGGDTLTAATPQGNVTVTASAELYDPDTGTWTATGSMTTMRENHTATKLLLGRVLVVGGDTSAELYDPLTGTWTATGSMTTARGRCTAILLPDNRVLVLGGDDPSGLSNGPVASAELYDPWTGTWTATASMTTMGFDRRASSAATLLSDGKVLVVDDSFSSGAAALYDPGSP
jgi:N-acetylneuraminic acid mutarotase